MATNKIIQISEKQTIDENGEILNEERSRVISLPVEPPYVKIYIDDLAKIYDVSPGPQLVLHSLISKMDYEGFISLTPASRQRLADSLQITVPTFNNYLSALCKTNIMRSVGRGEYEVNPHLFARGHWKDISKRRESFQLSITYKPDGTRIVKGDFAEKNESGYINEPKKLY